MGASFLAQNAGEALGHPEPGHIRSARKLFELVATADAVEVEELAAGA